MKRKFQFIKHDMPRDVDSTSGTEALIAFVNVTVAKKDTFGRVKLKFMALVKVRDTENKHSFLRDI